MARTTVTFRIAPPLYRLHGARIPTDSPDSRYWIEVQVVDLADMELAAFRSVGGAKVTVPGDPDGGLQNTLMTVGSPFAHDVDRGPGAGIPQAQVVAVRLVNRLIDHYRALTDAPLLRRIEPRRASWMRYRVEYNDGRVRDGTNLVPTGLPPEGTRRQARHANVR